MYQIFYLDPYQTKPFYLICSAVLDTSIDSIPDLQIVEGWLPYTNSLKLSLYQNYLANDIGAPCANPLQLSTTESRQGYGISWNWFNLTWITNYALIDFQNVNTFYSQNAVCAPTLINSGLVANNLVEFSAGDNSTSQYYYPDTTAVVAFNLTQLQAAQPSPTVLSIENNKTSNIDLVEQGDVLGCVTDIYDPSQIISRVATSIGQTNGNTITNLCTGTSTYFLAYADNNYTTEGTELVSPVSPVTCPFFSASLASGQFQCEADIYYYGEANPTVQYSNILNYKTANSSTNITYHYNGLGNCSGNFWTDGTGAGIWDIFNSNCPNFITRVNIFQFFINQLINAPEMFMLEWFLVIMAIFVIVLIVIPLMTRGQQRGV
jgi:hypothetical protein